LPKIIAVTGHRPPKLGGYSDKAVDRLYSFALNRIEKLQDQYKDLHIVTGMALGWDQAVASACYILSVPYTAALPFMDQDSKWPQVSRDEWRYLVEAADDVVIVSEGGYSAAKMQTRNKWMVDNSEGLLALWDGSAGGTSNCVGYFTSSKGKDAFYQNVWDEWVEYAKKNSI
jgi:uncharacterized phage-like protein YoqJ